MISRRTLVLAMLFAPAVSAAQIAGEPEAPSFDDRFKGDRDRVLEPCEVRNACQVEKIPDAPTPKPRPKKERKEKRRRHHGDICRGRGRTYYKNGKSWRCNRS